MIKSKLDTRIQEERLSTLIQNLPTSIFSTLLVSSFIFYVIYQKVPILYATAWVTSIILLSLIRLRYLYRIKTEKSTSLIKYEIPILAGILTSGIIFGSSLLFLFPFSDFSMQVLMFFLLSAMVAGSLGLYSMHILAFTFYSLPIFLFFIYRALTLEALATPLLVIGIVYYLVMFSTLFRVNKSILNSLQMQYLNQDLAKNLSFAKEELESSNSELKLENSVREETEKRLFRLANFDTLTGLPNRHMFKEDLKLAIKMAKNNNTRLAMLFLDLDNFKIINDTLGHAMGDKLLIAASSRLKSLLNGKSTIARLGGDEFVIIINEIEESSEIALLAEKIISLLELPFTFDEHEMFIGTSIGISLYPDDTTETNTLLSFADTAMYTAKEQGKNNYQFFTSKMHQKIQFRHDVETKLHHAVKNNELYIEYQPKIDLNTLKIIGAEALIRWDQKELGPISPSVFIPIAEESSLINQIGKWVISEVCRDLARLEHDFHNELCIGINISSSQILHQNLPQILQENLQKNQIDSRSIELEFTENMLIKQARKSLLVLDQLKQMGVKLSIDDFGTGYSSLNYLKTLPIHTLKIDKSFICETPYEKGDYAIAKSIIALAKNLNLDVIAEGVETAEQLKFLKDNGCSKVQGFYFSKALDINAFITYLNDPSFNLEHIKL